VARLVPFAAAIFVFQQVPTFAGNSGTWIDLVTPVVVIAAAAAGLRDASRCVLVLALFAAVVYVDGHGIHLAANDIGHYDVVSGKAEDVRHFWDERWGHVEWHLGLLGLLAALALADATPARPGRAELLAALLIGWTLFTNTVEGQDWFLTLGAAAVFGAWALARPARGVLTVAGAALVGAALIGVWAAWHGGVPQFSELGWF
jgi:hypothetical protein